MGGEFWSTIVYGFEYRNGCARLPIGEKYYTASIGTGGTPIYYCISLNSVTLEDIQKEINNLNEYQKLEIEEFDKFAEKYDMKPAWRLACKGDLYIHIMDTPDKEDLLDRFRQLENLYDDDGEFTEDTKDEIEYIFHEAHMGFMVKEALQLKTIEEIYELIEYYYSKC